MTTKETMPFYTHRPRIETPPAPALLNWSEIEVGDAVVLATNDGMIHSGIVDAVTYDGRIIWLLPEWPASRRMIHANDAVAISKQAEA